MRQRLLAPHAGQRSHRYFDALGGLLDRASEQWVRGQLGEDPVAVLAARPAPPRRTAPCDAGCPPSSRHPTPVVHAGCTKWRSSTAPWVSSGRVLPVHRPARPGSDRPAANARRRPRPPRAPSPRGLPRRHQLTNRLGGAADYTRLRRRDHGERRHRSRREHPVPRAPAGRAVPPTPSHPNRRSATAAATGGR